MSHMAQSVTKSAIQNQELNRRAHDRQLSEMRRMTRRVVAKRPRMWTNHVCGLLADAGLIEQSHELDRDEYRDDVLDRFQSALCSFVGVQTDSISKEEAAESFSRVPIICFNSDQIMTLQTGLEINAERMSFDEKIQFVAAAPDLMDVNHRIRARHRVVYTDNLMFAVGGFPRQLGPPKLLPTARIDRAHKQAWPVAYQIGVIQTAAPSFATHFLDRGLLVSNKPFAPNAPDSIDDQYDLSIPYVAFAKTLGDTIPWHCVHYGESTHADIPGATIHLKYYAYFWTMVSQLSNILQTANAAMEPGAMIRPQWNEMGLRDDLEIVQPKEDAPAILRMSAIGIGSFSRWNQNGFEFDISRFVQIMLVNALKCALILSPGPRSDRPNEKYPDFPSFPKFPAAPKYPNIHRIELCDFDVFSTKNLWEMWDDRVFHRSCNNHIDIATLDGQDLLAFTPEQIQNNRCVVVNAGDAFSLPGNEFGYGGVDSMVGNNTTLRITQSYLTNQTLMAHEGPHFHETMSPLAQHLECMRELRPEVNHERQRAVSEFLEYMYERITESVKEGRRSVYSRG